MNDLNTLMQRIDEINHKSPIELVPEDINDLIKYHRRARELKASGEKPKRKSSAGSAIDLDVLMSVTKPEGPKITRRI